MNDKKSLTHTRWKVFYGEKRREIGEILRTLCDWKKIKIIEAEVCPDHVHMLIEIPPKIVATNLFWGTRVQLLHKKKLRDSF